MSNGVRSKLSPLQIVSLIGLIAGFGLTVTTKSKGVPAHPLTEGVTVKVAVCGEPVVFVNVPLILEAPLPGEPPVIPPEVTGIGQL